jgi:hypothetical protein
MSVKFVRASEKMSLFSEQKGYISSRIPSQSVIHAKAGILGLVRQEARFHRADNFQ